MTARIQEVTATAAEVQELLRGQREIDRMRKDIDQFVGTILGLAELRIQARSDSSSWDFRSDKFCWEIHRTRHQNPHDRKIVVKCKRIGTFPMEFTVYNFVFRAEVLYGLGREDVQVVWENLKVLLGGVLKNQLVFEDELRPFKRAAEAVAGDFIS